MHNFATGKLTLVPFYQVIQAKWEDEKHLLFLFV